MVKAPETDAAPPVVNVPVPVVIGLLVVVLRPKTPVPVMSIMELLPARVMALPLAVRFPPAVNSPVPVVTAPLLTVFKFTVPVPAETVKLAFPVVPMVEAWLKVIFPLVAFKASLAVAVAVPPINTSSVMKVGASAPNALCQYPKVPVVGVVVVKF